METPPSDDSVWYFTSEELEALENNPPVFLGLPLEKICALNEEIRAHIKYDDAYFARSLARKNLQPFVM